MASVSVGNILIAEPFLGDDNFERAVVLITSHSEEGSFGFILNKLCNLYLSDIVPDIGTLEARLHIGGPVEQDTLHFIYKGYSPMADSVNIFDNLYWGGNFEELKWRILHHKISERDIRFFLGYSGWAQGQLEDEMKKNVWIVNHISVEDIFETSTDQMWRVILKNMGGKYKQYANYPIDPRLN
ncbi:MAG: YqgE/AlgH family protein [Cytophagaceae bacterium]|nr:YqgE/AlgH family protein [Cytophagaceae bacterium]MDW8455768.1 YqgE/AlgH family protein [Cytophagaceae bacterium]